ncbi:hypothetical protein GTY41_38280 [Streptomyces sp. SID685]|uniref:hypothetical protein n=1 Tax=Streptomyces sp. SID685 TaxID=2690322 RepID=UPI00136EE4D6|nr:hypothetical protein [Streptomyces sp. SID685]MYR90611.1 hypothetical protein [Streptomyces sp. SID685]
MLGETGWLHDCPPPPGMGRAEIASLMLNFERFAVARCAVQDVLTAHLREAADPAVTVEGRAAALGSDQ